METSLKVPLPSSILHESHSAPRLLYILLQEIQTARNAGLSPKEMQANAARPPVLRHNCDNSRVAKEPVESGAQHTPKAHIQVRRAHFHRWNASAS